MQEDVPDILIDEREREKECSNLVEVRKKLRHHKCGSVRVLARGLSPDMRLIAWESS